MYNTEGVDAVATITELRSKTSDLIDSVKSKNNGVRLVVLLNQHAVVLRLHAVDEIGGFRAEFGDGGDGVNAFGIVHFWS